MKQSKIIKTVTCILLASSLLMGCANKNSDGSDKSTEPIGNSQTQSKVESGEVNLIVWNEPNPNDELNMYKQAEKATGVKVNVTVVPESDYSSKLNQMVATKDDSVDIYVVWENDISNFAETGGILALDDYLKDSSIKTDDFIDAVSKLSEGLGGTYGLPWCAATEIMYYNQDMFDEAGIAYPDNNWAYEDFLAAAEKLTKKADDGSTIVYGWDLPNTQTWWAGIGGAGDQVYDPKSGELVIGDGAAKFISDCANAVKDGIMPAPSSDTTDLFGAGKVAMSWQGSWSIGTYGGELPFNWDIATIPTDHVKYNTLHTGFYTINANSKAPEAAFKVIEYLMGEEGQAINSKASGNPSAIKTIADKQEWKVESATTIDNWDAITDSLAAGVFGYTCLPAGVTNNAISEFNSVLLGQKEASEAVDAAMEYAKTTIGY